jgi:hypothetical protein
MNQTDIRIQNRNHIQRIAREVLDGLDRVLDAMTPPPANKPPLSVVRRQTANMLGLARLCANNTCRRARCCRGEPLHCLRTTIFLLPPEQIERLLLRRKHKRRRKT